jgi:hypothetical protein
MLKHQKALNLAFNDLFLATLKGAVNGFVLRFELTVRPAAGFQKSCAPIGLLGVGL